MDLLTGAVANDPNITAALIQESLDKRLGNGRVIITPATSGPQLNVFSCLLRFGAKPEDIETMSGAIAMTAGATHCRISRTDGMLLLEIPKLEGMRQTLYADWFESKLRWDDKSPTAVPVGLTTGNRPLWIDIADERWAHILVAGVTGTGKTVLLKWILYRLLMQIPASKLAVVAADPKIAHPVKGLRPFAYAQHLLHPIQSDASEVVRLLTWVTMEMERRKMLGVTEPRLLVVLEEVADYADQSKHVQPLLKRIMQVGRDWNINVLAATQHPGAKSIGDAIINFSCLMLGRVARGTQVFGASGRKGTNADELLMKGDMLYIGAGNETVRFQAPMADSRQWRNIPRGQLRSLDAQLPNVESLDTGMNSRRGGRPGALITPADIERARRLIQSGRGVNAIREELHIGTATARTLYMDIQKGDT